jgi:hypothetical protein
MVVALVLTPGQNETKKLILGLILQKTIKIMILVLKINPSSSLVLGNSHWNQWLTIS